jgi:hypothetical protein
MALPVPSWTEADDTTAGAPLAFSGLLPGTPSAWQERHLWNNRAGVTPVDPVRNARLRVRARVAGDTDWRSDGIVALETRAVEVEILGGSVGSGIEARSPVRIGAGAWLDLPEVPNDAAVFLRFRVNLPGTAGEDSLQLDFAVELEPAEALPSGLWEAAGGGIRLGIGDGAVSRILMGSAPLAAGTPDDTIAVPDLIWGLGGKPFVRLETVETLDDTDGAAATLAAGEAYYALLSLGADLLTITKGAKAVEPLDATDMPATPAGEIAYARILRGFDGLINDPDILLLTSTWGFQLRSSGLSVFAGSGEAIVGARYVRTMTESQTAAPASSTSRIWLLPTGTMTATADGSRPDDRALLLGEAVSDGSAVTLLTDLREFQDQHVTRAQFAFPTPTVADAAYWTNAARTPLYLRPLAPILLALADDPAVLAPSSGSWKLDLELLQTDFSWSSLFPSSGTDDRRPAIPFDSTTGRDVSALPEVLEIPPGGVLRCSVVSIPTGGTPATALLASILLESPLG